MRKALVLGAGGFIGAHLVRRLREMDFHVSGVDLKKPPFSPTHAHKFIVGDLRDYDLCKQVLAEKPDEVYQLAADMGGAGYLFTGDNDADVIHNSAQINLNVVKAASLAGVGKIFFSSSACIYPRGNQQDAHNPDCSEASAYPADPDSEYGWEKLFSERLYAAFRKNYGLDTRTARFHNVYGPEGTWEGGKEKAPAAIARKVAATKEGGAVEIWGDGRQTRSFLYIDDCIEGILALMRSNYSEPVNIGSEEMISIEDFTKMVIGISGKQLAVEYVPGPQGVRGRNSDNRLMREKTGWSPRLSLCSGMSKTYDWIAQRVNNSSLIINK